MVSSDLRTIGTIGLSIISCLIVIVVYRTIRFWQITKLEDVGYYHYRKKILFHLFLFLSPVFDMPLYIGFILYNEYLLTLYAFHKFSAACLYIAYSITIHDWINVLREIEKDTIYPFMTRKVNNIYYIGDAALIAINTMFVGIAISNFIYIFVINNLDIYLESYVYVVGIFIQIAAAWLLTGCMLYAGVRLSCRIRGVTGSLGNNRFANPGLTRSLSTSHPGVSHEFRTALLSLNLVMATCSFCIFVQMMILILNYALGYADKTNAYVGPIYFYWTFYAWLPLWGPILALLYLSRHGYSRQPSHRASLPPAMAIINDHNPEAVRIDSMSSTEGENSALDGKILADEHNAMLRNGRGQSGSGSMFFSDDATSPDSSLSYYLNGNSRQLPSEQYYRDLPVISPINIGDLRSTDGSVSDDKYHLMDNP